MTASASAPPALRSKRVRKLSDTRVVNRAEQFRDIGEKGTASPTAAAATSADATTAAAATSAATTNSAAADIP